MTRSSNPVPARLLPVRAADPPTLSVVLPLHEDRGCFEACLDGWRQQTCAPEAFEIVIASASTNSPDARVARAHLRARDRFVHEPGGKEMALYGAALAQARGALILFSELHCVPARDVIERALAHFAHPDEQAATLEIVRVGAGRMAREEARLSTRTDSELTATEPWRLVSMRGLAIRRSVLAVAGDLDPTFERFAETALGARLSERGIRIGHIPRARIRHQDSETWSDLAPALRASGRGQAAYRLAMEHGSVPRVLRPESSWDGRGLLAPLVAAHTTRLAWQRLLHVVKHAHGWLGEIESCDLGRVIADALATRALGMHLWSWAARARAWVAFLRWRLASIQRADSSSEFERLWSALLRDGLVEFLASRSDRAGHAVTIGETALTMDQVPNSALVGFYDLEHWSGEPCRWSKPFAAVRVVLEPIGVDAHPVGSSDQRLRLTVDARSPIPVKDRNLWLGWDGEWIPPEHAEWSDENHVSFELPAATGRVGKEHLLSLACKPFLPQSIDLGDARTLGVAIFSLRIAAPSAPCS